MEHLGVPYDKYMLPGSIFCQKFFFGPSKHIYIIIWTSFLCFNGGKWATHDDPFLKIMSNNT